MTKRIKKWIKKCFYYLFTILLSLLFLLPMWMVFVNAFKEKADARFFALSLPTEWIWENFEIVIEMGNVIRAFFNGLIVSGGSVIVVLLLSAFAAFPIARSSEKWAKYIYYLFLCGLVVPVAFIPTFLVLDFLHLFNSYLGLILVSATYGIPMSVFLYTGFIKSVPREMDEAAILDGCTTFQLLCRVIMPLIKPITVTLFIFNFIGCWNDIQVPLYFSNSEKWNMPLTLYNFYGTYGSSWNLIFADIVLTVLPLLLLYLFCQKYIIAGMTAGAVKG